MLLAPVAKSIEQILSFVSTPATQTPVAPASNGCSDRCTAATLETCGTRLALGWSDGGVSLFRLGVRRPDPKSSPSQRLLALEPPRDHSMQYWGYAPRDVGDVSALAWTHDARALAVGFSARGFSVFSTDGCGLLSSLPRHHSGSRAAPDEICASGVTALVWTRSSSSLVVVDRRQPSAVETATANDVTETPGAARAPVVKELQDLAERIDVPLSNGDDGLCLSLSGTPGAWVRSEHCFTRRRDGSEGPAEASGKICGGDLLVAINGDDSVALLAFDAVIQRLKVVPQDSTVTLTLLRLRWPVVYPLAVAALASPPFLDRNGLTPLFSDDNEPMDEDLCLRECALRMQEQHGDCESDDVDGTGRLPSLLEIVRRAKFESWSALQGMPRDVAQHKYLKLLLALSPTCARSRRWSSSRATWSSRGRRRGVRFVSARSLVARRRPRWRPRAAGYRPDADGAPTRVTSAAAYSISRLCLVPCTWRRTLRSPVVDDHNAGAATACAQSQREQRCLLVIVVRDAARRWRSSRPV
ncbi:hypothetical protein PINS_up016407 [Pythium insidiosum]|nr:hypothetical protein PINS_up016407 [Pythium insidiosum]